VKGQGEGGRGDGSVGFGIEVDVDVDILHHFYEWIGAGFGYIDRRRIVLMLSTIYFVFFFSAFQRLVSFLALSIRSISTYGYHGFYGAVFSVVLGMACGQSIFPVVSHLSWSWS